MEELLPAALTAMHFYFWQIRTSLGSFPLDITLVLSDFATFGILTGKIWLNINLFWQKKLGDTAHNVQEQLIVGVSIIVHYTVLYALNSMIW